MPYPEIMIKPMREELTRLGAVELRSAEAVDEALADSGETVMLVVNSICGCAAGRARPGLALALQHSRRPNKIVTVFAGADIEATKRAREYLAGHPPSSPSIALLKEGKPIFMLGRHQIEGKDPTQIARELTTAFDRYCAQ